MYGLYTCIYMYGKLEIAVSNPVQPTSAYFLGKRLPVHTLLCLVKNVNVHVCTFSLDLGVFDGLIIPAFSV